VIRTLIIVSVIIILSFSVVNAEPYKSKYIEDIPTTWVVDDSVAMSNRALDYTVSYQSDKNKDLLVAYPPEDIKNSLNEIVSYYMLFMKKEGMSSADCRIGFSPNIFIISKERMLSEDRFLAYFKSIGWDGGIVYAFYDTTPEIKANPAILLTDLSPRQNYLSLAHEMAHYMWDRQCLVNSYGNNSELFASKFEAYIKDNTK